MLCDLSIKKKKVVMPAMKSLVSDSQVFSILMIEGKLRITRFETLNQIELEQASSINLGFTYYVETLNHFSGESKSIIVL